MPRAPRTGQLNLLWTLLLAAASTIVLLVALLYVGGPRVDDTTRVLRVYCAAGLRFPLEEVARKYEEEFGVVIEPQYGGSNTLLNQLEIDKFTHVDLYLAADEFYTTAAREKGLAAEVFSLASMRPVLAVRQDSGLQIESFANIIEGDLSIAVAHPDQASIGQTSYERLSERPFGDTNMWEALDQHITQQRRGVYKPTVNDVASDIRLGSVDAGIIWDSTVAMPTFREELQAIALPELDGEPMQISLCVLNASRQPGAALKFARYLTARDRGLPVFAAYGMEPVEGDVWAERPEINFFCGAVNRRAVEEIVLQFERREGVVVNTIYDGCGILTSRMETIDGQSTTHGFPDIYMACDLYYLENVRSWFQNAANVSETDIVIAVPKGSTRVRDLSDLVKPGIRVAVGEPDQCTIGALTRRLLVDAGLYDELMAKQQRDGEVVVEKSSSALLVPDVVTGHVDAAVAYITDVMPNRDRVDVVRIQSPLNRAVQPLSIARSSRHKHLARRLFQRIAESPEAFEQVGFRFRGMEPGVFEDPPEEEL